MYFYNDFIFINEQREGVHILDNSNPEVPANIGFIAIPGNVDIAIRNNVLYADNYVDLLTINISDIGNPQLVHRNENVFPHFGDTSEGLLVYFHQEEVTEVVDCNTDGPSRRNDLFFGAPQAEVFSLDNNSGDLGGIGGSLARFALYGQLFVLH